MKARKLVLRATLLGVSADIATIKIGGYARAPDLRDWTTLVCPNDFEKGKIQKATFHPSYYECDCGFKATTWQKLKRVRKGTFDPVEQPKLTKGNDEIERALIYTMSFKEFVKYVDARDPKEPERFISAEDESSRENLFKLLVAHEMDKTAIILKWNDTTQEIIALLTTTVSGRIILAPIIPKNLLQLKESLMLDKTHLTEKDIEEARMFLKQIPNATEETMCVKDYRVGSLEVTGKPQQGKVEQLAVIMHRAKKAKKK